MHAEGQLLLRVFVELLALGEGLGDHAALLDPLGLVVTAANHPAAHGETKWRPCLGSLSCWDSFKTGEPIS